MKPFIIDISMQPLGFGGYGAREEEEEEESVKEIENGREDYLKPNCTVGIMGYQTRLSLFFIVCLSTPELADVITGVSKAKRLPKAYICMI